MSRAIFAIAIVLALVAAAPALPAQALKSSPQPGDTLPGAFQPFNINGPFAGRYHCLVTEFRLNPVALVFVRAQQDVVDAEVKKLLEALDKVAVEQHNDNGIETFVVFLTPSARSGATEDKTEDPKSVLAEAKSREKLVSELKDFAAKTVKRLIVTCCPADSVAKQYGLADTAEVTVLAYARHQVFANFSFGEGKLNQEGVNNVLKGVEDMLTRLRKGPDKLTR